MEETRNKTRRILNLKCLKRQFRGIDDILVMSKYSVVFYMETMVKVFHKLNKNGAFFVCSSTDFPGVRLILLNQQDDTDLCIKSEDITGMQLNDAQSIINIRLRSEDVYGFWFYDKKELQNIWEALQPYNSANKSKKTA